MAFSRGAKFAIALVVILLLGGLLTAVANRRNQLNNAELEKFSFGGLERTYLLHEPAAKGAGPYPLVLVFHGGGGEASGVDKLTHFNKISDREGFLAVYPNGVMKHWNDGRGTVNPDIDDVGFISALIDFLVAKKNVDSKRVFITGISNGGMFCHRLAFELPNKIAAAAPVAGSIAVNIATKGQPAAAVPFISFHGTLDTLVPYGGGEVAWNGGTVLAVPEASAHWATWDNCTQPAETKYIPDKVDDSMKVRLESYPNGTGGSEVLLYTVEGGGHTWPGGWQYMGEKIVGKTCRDIDASELIWEFFKKHSRA